MMTRQPNKISLEKEIVILQFWAQAIDILRSFSPEEIKSVQGLSQALEAARRLPDAIGWGEEQSIPGHESLDCEAEN